MCKKMIYLSVFVVFAALVGQASGGDKASNPNPANGAVSVEPNTVLTWSPGIYAASHDVYLGTVFNDVNNANTISPEYKGRQSSTTYNPRGLDLNMTYYWRIDEVNNSWPASPWKGDVWSFSTTFMFNGLEVTPLGQAKLEIIDSNLTVSNIGSSGDDGVRIELPVYYNRWNCIMKNLDDSNSLPTGAEMEMATSCTINGEPNLLGSLFIKKVSYGNWRLDVSSEANSYTLDGYLDNELVYREKDFNGPPILILMEPQRQNVGYITEPCFVQPWSWHSEYLWDLYTQDLIDCGLTLDESLWVNFLPSYHERAITVNNIMLKPALEPISAPNVPSVKVEITAKDIPSFIITHMTVEQLCTNIIPGDINQDCYVNFFDLSILANNWLECNKPDDPTCTWSP